MSQEKAARLFICFSLPGLKQKWTCNEKKIQTRLELFCLKLDFHGKPDAKVMYGILWLSSAIAIG